MLDDPPQLADLAAVERQLIEVGKPPIDTAREVGQRPRGGARWHTQLDRPRAAHPQRGAVPRGQARADPAQPSIAGPDPPSIRTPIAPYSLEEVRRLLDAAVGSRNAARWTIGAVLGLRQGEALGLQWADLAPGSGTLSVVRQIQRRLWEHCCPADAPCGGKRGADCPQWHGGGLATSPPKSDAGRRTIALPPTLLAELIAHRKA